MGNSSSTAEREGPSTHEDGTDPSGGQAGVSGVFLNPDLQVKLEQDFESAVLQTQWQEHQKGILSRINERQTQDDQRRQALEQQLAAFREQNQDVQAKLDSRIDEMSARFADLTVEIEHDVSQLEDKLGHGPKFGDGKACITVRADLSSCYKDAKDFRECNGYVDALEKCMEKTLTAQ